jgi:hypothetical protein
MQPELLGPFMKGWATAGNETQVRELRDVFLEVAKFRPGLMERSIRAEYEKNSVEIEKLLREIQKVMVELCNSGSIKTPISPYFSHLRFNHNSGRVHIGMGGRSFPLLF